MPIPTPCSARRGFAARRTRSHAFCAHRRTLGRFSKHEIFRPQKIGAKAARFELPACLFALFGQKVFVVAPFQIARSGQFSSMGSVFILCFWASLEVVSRPLAFSDFSSSS